MLNRNTLRAAAIVISVAVAGCKPPGPGEVSTPGHISGADSCPRVSLPAEERADSSQPAVVQIAQFDDAAATLSDLRDRFGAEKILVVFDLDNTLLTAEQDLGSDAWYTWQETLINANPPDPACREAKDIDTLLQTQGLLFVLGRMRPTEAAGDGGTGTAEFVKSLQRTGYKLLVLTSRGSSFNDVTRRELQRNGLCFEGSAVGPAGGFAGEVMIVPTDEAELRRHLPPDHPGLVERVKRAKPIRYEDGVLFTAGQHKGGMLRLLLWKTGTETAFKAIVFFDDTQKHTARMREAFDRSQIELHVFHYVSPSVLSAAKLIDDAPRQSAIHAQWKLLEADLRDVYGTGPVGEAPPPCE